MSNSHLLTPYKVPCYPLQGGIVSYHTDHHPTEQVRMPRLGEME